MAEIPLPSKMNGECDISALSLSNASDSPLAEAYQMLRMAVILEDLAGELVYDGDIPRLRHSVPRQSRLRTFGLIDWIYTHSIPVRSFWWFLPAKNQPGPLLWPTSLGPMPGQAYGF